MSQLLLCPACHGITSLAIEAVRDVRLRCPHCEAEFPVEELRASSVPCWQVVESTTPIAANGPAQIAKETHESVDSHDVAGTSGAAEVVSCDMELSPAAFPAMSETALAKIDWSSFQSLTHDQYQRMKRQRHPPSWWPVLKVALGGLAAIPIALLLIWHVVGTDIADAGPAVGRYLPWIVPQKFRPYSSGLADASFIPDRPARQPAPRDSTWKTGFSAGFESISASPLPLASQSPSQAPLPEQPQTQKRAAPNVQDELSGPGDRSNRLAAEVRAVIDELRPPTIAPPATVSMQTSGKGADGQPELQKTLADEQASQHLKTFLDQTRQHLDEWLEAVDSRATNLQPIAQTLYGNFTSLALAMGALSPESPLMSELRQQLLPIGAVVHANSEVRRLISQGARYWIQAESKKNREYGLALLIEVEQVIELAQYWLVTVSPTTDLGPSDLTVRIPREIAEVVRAKQRLFLLGTVIPQKSPPATPESAILTANYLQEL